MQELRFRQVHLDFHTSEHIAGIGTAFDPAEWVDTLTRARVNAITLFAVCHHGWHYHRTAVGVMHPHLHFDLLQAQFDAAKQAGINVQVYVSAGANHRIQELRRDWRVVRPEDRGVEELESGFRPLCFNTPYLELLCDEIRETATRFPTADGLFLDIIHQTECLCGYCRASMERLGLNATDPADRARHAALVLRNYYTRTLAALRGVAPAMPLFQNSGHVRRGNREYYQYVTHLELESLPTGGWGYDHFPMSALSAAHSGLDYLGMTGKFHASWGEFGGFKHPDALRYECAAMLAFGSKCSVGDQLHPEGRLDPETYRLIGQAYREVEAKEPWCRGARPVAEIGVLSAEAVARHPENDWADTGAARLLLESHLLFTLLDADDEFSAYRLLILPDRVRVDAALFEKLSAYLAGGGQLLLTGASGLDADGAMLFDIGGTVEGDSVYAPVFLAPEEGVAPEWCHSPFVHYRRGKQLRVTDGDRLAAVFEPYFNREWHRFCSHCHAPPRPTPAEWAGGVRKGPIAYLPYPVFAEYRDRGAAVLRRMVERVIWSLLGAPLVTVEGLAVSGRVTLTEQREPARRILHLLYAEFITRGGAPTAVTVIEGLPPTSPLAVTLRRSGAVRAVRLEPEGVALPFTRDGDTLSFTVPSFRGHAMVVLA